MRGITLTELLEAGCHFGHVVTRQNPKAREFIFEERDKIHIIDLAKTKEGLEAAAAFVKTLANRGGKIIFVGTKRQAQSIIKEEAQRCGALFVDKRWIGGIISNFEEVSKNFKKLKKLEEQLTSEQAKEGYTKREVGLWEKERVKLESLYGGIKNLEKIPDALFIIDVHQEEAAVREASRRGVAVTGLVDTNADPTLVDYPIPANDDAVGSIKLITSYLADAWIEGSKLKLEAETKETEVKIKKEVKGGKRKPKTTKKTA